MTEIESKILEQIRKGPKSLTELFGILGATMTAAALDNALDALLDGKKCEYMPAVGTWKPGVHA
ncbi:MAG TPA: hypothetical protein VMV63_07395 [Acidithiobacillus sp.]|nr:hypothetical protein [Acidithiobacillus sp.]